MAAAAQNKSNYSIQTMNAHQIYYAYPFCVYFPKLLFPFLPQFYVNILTELCIPPAKTRNI